MDETRFALLEKAVQDNAGNIRALQESLQKVYQVVFGRNGGWREPGLVQEVKDNREEIAKMRQEIETLKAHQKRQGNVIIGLLILLLILNGANVSPVVMTWLTKLLGLP